MMRRLTFLPVLLVLLSVPTALAQTSVATGTVACALNAAKVELHCSASLSPGSSLRETTAFTLICGAGSFRTTALPVTLVPVPLGTPRPEKPTPTPFTLGPVTKAGAYVASCDLMNVGGTRVWTGTAPAVSVTDRQILDGTGRTNTKDPLLNITLACKEVEAGIDTKISCTVTMPADVYERYKGTSRTGSFDVAGTQSKKVPFTITGGNPGGYTKDFDLGTVKKPGTYTITGAIAVPDRGLDIRWKKEATVDLDQHGNAPGSYDVKLKVVATATAGKMQVVVTPELPDGPAQGDKLQVKITPLGEVSTVAYQGSAVTVDDLNVPNSTTQTVEATLRQGDKVLATATASLKVDDKGNGSVTKDETSTAGDAAGGQGAPGGESGPPKVVLEPAPSLNEVLETTDPVQGGKVSLPGLSRLIRQNIQSTKGLAGVLLAFVLSFVGVIALFVLVFSGFRYITGGGDGAKKAIAGVVIGIIVILGAWVFVTTILNLGAGPPI